MISRLAYTFAVVILLAIRSATAAEPATYDWSAAQEIASGIRYTHLTLTEPHTAEVYAMQIDSRHPRVRFHTTGPYAEWIGNLHETMRTTTRDFVREARVAGTDMVAAINADAFEPWPAPYAARTLTNLQGLAVSDGEMVSPPTEDPSFIVYDDGRVAIVPSVGSLAHIQIAVSGFAIVLAEGVASGKDERLVPRTGIGVSQDRRFVYFLVVDGRRRATEGASTQEVGEWLKHFGAYDGINLDGGGSATLVRHDPNAAGDGVVLLNSPVGDGTDWRKLDPAAERDKYAPTERANGNNLGVYLAPENP